MNRGVMGFKPLFQQVNIVVLQTLSSTLLLDLVVDRSHPLYHLIWTLPLSEELAFIFRYKDNYLVPRVELSELGTIVIHSGLGQQGLLHVFPVKGPDFSQCSMTERWGDGCCSQVSLARPSIPHTAAQKGRILWTSQTAKSI